MTVRVQLDTTVTIGKSGTVDLQSFSGDITVTGWDRDQVKVHAISNSRLRFDSSPSRVTLIGDPPMDGDYDNDDETRRLSRSACRNPAGCSFARSRATSRCATSRMWRRTR